MKTLLTLIWFFTLQYVYGQDTLQIVLRKIAKSEIIGLKELKKIDVIKHDSFTQKGWIIKELKEEFIYAESKKNKAEAYNKLAVSKNTLLKKMTQQHKPTAQLKREIDDIVELTKNELNDFDGSIKRINNNSSLLGLADSIEIVKRIVVAKFYYTDVLDTLSISSYNVELAKGFRLIYARKED